MLSPRGSRVLQVLTLIALVITATFPYVLYELWWLFLLCFPIGWFFIALLLAPLLLLLDAGLSQVRNRPSAHIKTAWIPLALQLALWFVPPVSSAFLWIGAAPRLSQHLEEYEAAIARAQSGAAPEQPIYLLDTEPRPLYAFSWGGFTDNWCGVVHDEARAFDAEPTTVLGGDLISRVHLWGPWYYVEFT
jgi:hypothetical protein